MRRIALIAPLVVLCVGLLLWWLHDRSPAAGIPAAVTLDGGASDAAPTGADAQRPAARAEARAAASASAVPAASVDASAAAPTAGRGRRSFLGQLIDDGLSLVPEVGQQVRTWVAPVQARIFFARNASLAQQHADRYCERARRMRENPLFEDAAAVSDAGPFLAQRIDWLPGPAGTLHLPDAVSLRLRGQQWPTAFTAEELAAFDFSWLRELAAFDHWRLPNGDPDGVEHGFWDGPFPDYVQLTGWSKLRLAAGLQRGDVRIAASEVHHLAQLVHTQGNVSANLVAGSLLALERRAWELARERGLEVDGWTTIERAALRERSRLLFAEMAFYWPLVEPAVTRQVFECGLDPCAALVEGLAVRGGMRSLLGGVEPLTGLDPARCDRGRLAHAARTQAMSALDAAGAMTESSPIETWVGADDTR